jgi:hypothetical protein
MADLVAAAKFDWQPERKILVVSDASGTVSLAFPIMGLPALGFQAQRFMAGERAKLAREEARRKERTGWLGISAPTAETARVQTMQTLQGDRIVLIFDPETDREFPVSFVTREFALEVGKALVATATAQPSSPATRN